MITNKELMELLDICLRLRVERGVDVFFEFSPHVDAVHIRVFLNGWHTDAEQDFDFTVYTRIVYEFPTEKENRENYINAAGFLNGLLYAKRTAPDEVNKNV